MKRQLLTCATLCALGLGARHAQAISIDFSSTPSAVVTFTGGAGNSDFFSFVNQVVPESVPDFMITSPVGTPSFGDLGEITGSFQIGAVTIIPGGIQLAPVTGSGTLSIADGLGNTFSGTLQFTDISTVGNSRSTGGTILSGVLNLTSITYGPLAAEADLRAFAINGDGSAVITFQFAPGRTLSQLKATNARNSTSFSGTLATDDVPDAGATAALLGIGFLGVAGLRRKLS